MNRAWSISIAILLGSSESLALSPLNPEDNVDKFAHFGLSCSLTGSLETFGKGLNEEYKITNKNRLLSSTFVMALGIYKELRDLREGGDGRDSARDVVADAVGIAVGNLIHWEF